MLTSFQVNFAARMTLFCLKMIDCHSSTHY
jgi:hypothetical protein